MRCADRCLSSSALSKLSPQPWPRGCHLILCARMRELGLGAHSSARGQHACQPSGTGTPVILMLPGFNCKEPFRIRGSIVVSISACHAEDPGSIPGRGAACTDRAHHNGQLLMQPGLGQRVPCFWVCPPSSAVLGRRRWPQNRTKGQRARAERDGPRLAQICRSRLSWSLGPRAAVALMISRRAEPLRSGAATCGASPR